MGQNKKNKMPNKIPHGLIATVHFAIMNLEMYLIEEREMINIMESQ